MARNRRRYTSEYKAEAVKLVQERGLSYAEAAREMKTSKSSIRSWCSLAERGELGVAKSGSSPMTAQDELHRLRKEVRLLREEREILKKAAAFFAKESL